MNSEASKQSKASEVESIKVIQTNHWKSLFQKMIVENQLKLTAKAYQRK